jgi:hypothetical protein
MRARFDQFTKGIFREALAPAGTVRNQDEIAAEAQAIDTRFEPDPARAQALEGLGRLGEMARVPCLFEAFHGTVDLTEFRSCVRKQLTLDHVESGRARRKKRPVPPFPHLWVLSAGRPERVMDGYTFTPIPGWPAGFLQRSEADAVGLVVLRQLPRRRDTLLLRLMGADAVLDDAIAELARLPKDARERQVTVTSLVAFRTKISHDPTNEERAFLMSTEPLYEQWEKQVKNLGRKEGQRVMLLDLLRTRFGVLPRATVARVKAADAAQLSRWAKRVLSAPTLEDVLRAS